MKVLALISGGKDSIFNIAKCIEQGHEIVALGNMFNEGIISLSKIKFTINRARKIRKVT